MGKGLGIGALVLAIVAIFIPVIGLYTGWIALVLAAIAARYGERPVPIAVVAISAVNFIFLTPSLWMTSYAMAEHRSQLNPQLIISMAMLIVPVAAMIIGRKGAKASELG